MYERFCLGMFLAAFLAASNVDICLSFRTVLSFMLIYFDVESYMFLSEIIVKDLRVFFKLGWFHCKLGLKFL